MTRSVTGGWVLDPTIILMDGSACWCDPRVFDYTTPHIPRCQKRRACKQHPSQLWIPETSEWECQKCGVRVTA